MLVWIDLTNSPHVAFFDPVVDRLKIEGHDVLLSARDHAQTVELAQQTWQDVFVIGGRSDTSSRVAKGSALAARAALLHRLARRSTPHVALSHGSYAQILAARGARLPVITLMDYEYQPANHLSFRLAHRVLVPEAFPASALRRFGARRSKVVRYEGFKEDLYLAGFAPDPNVLEGIGVDCRNVLVVVRPPPTGALYHRHANKQFDQLVEFCQLHSNTQVVLLPRRPEQVRDYTLANVIVPPRAVDGRSLLASADLFIGAGGTMTREAALLGVPTYTVFAGQLAAVDAQLIRAGLIRDIRHSPTLPSLTKKPPRDSAASRRRRDSILQKITDNVKEMGTAQNTRDHKRVPKT